MEDGGSSQAFSRMHHRGTIQLPYTFLQKHDPVSSPPCILSLFLVWISTSELACPLVSIPMPHPLALKPFFINEGIPLSFMLSETGNYAGQSLDIVIAEFSSWAEERSYVTSSDVHSLGESWNEESKSWNAPVLVWKTSFLRNFRCHISKTVQHVATKLLSGVSPRCLPSSCCLSACSKIESLKNAECLVWKAYFKVYQFLNSLFRKWKAKAE